MKGERQFHKKAVSDQRSAVWADASWPTVGGHGLNWLRFSWRLAAGQGGGQAMRFRDSPEIGFVPLEIWERASDQRAGCLESSLVFFLKLKNDR
jgi:hypothetical protein